MVRNESWIFPAILIAFVSVLWAAGFALLTGFQSRPSGSTSLAASLVIIAVAACWRLLRYVVRLWGAGVPDPLRRLRRDFLPAAGAFAPIVIGVAVLGTFLCSLTFLKSMIVAVVPFWADAPLAAVDRMLHLDPAAIASALQPVITPVGRFYGLWHVVHLGGILWVLHWQGGQKSRLIISFMLIWAIGTALAYVFSSAGPIFTGRYDPALAPESMRRMVHFLWTNYEQRNATLGAGISAFPSMHVALAMWFAFALRAKGLWWLGIAYTVSIFAGSIILGWHYSLDGIGGIGVAIVGWTLAPHLLNATNNWRGPTLVSVSDLGRPPVVR